MADADEAKSTAPTEAPPTEAPSTAGEKEEPAPPAPAAEDAVYHPPPEEPPVQKSRKDFWICILLLVLFGLVCAIGYFVLGMIVYKEEGKTGRWELLNPRRPGAGVYHGVPFENRTGKK